MRQTFEHFLNTATVMKSPKPLSISIFDYLKRFDSGLRHDLKPLIFKGFFDVWIYLYPSGSLRIYSIFSKQISTVDRLSKNEGLICEASCNIIKIQQWM